MGGVSIIAPCLQGWVRTPPFPLCVRACCACACACVCVLRLPLENFKKCFKAAAADFELALFNRWYRSTARLACASAPLNSSFERSSAIGSGNAVDIAPVYNSLFRNPQSGTCCPFSFWLV